jgi:sn-glycerol 3-phosphate transport system ATP-binding protein
MTMADQVVLLRQGRVEQDAPPDLLYAQPATVFAARFIGTPPMNVLRLAPGPSGAVIAGSDGPPVLRGTADELLLGVRPEDAVLGAHGVPAQVESMEYLGADSLVACRIGSEAMIVRAPGRVALPAGAPVHVAWRPESIHLFDAATGVRRDAARTSVLETV